MQRSSNTLKICRYCIAAIKFHALLQRQHFNNIKEQREAQILSTADF
jgi:hypothetical protein